MKKPVPMQPKPPAGKALHPLVQKALARLMAICKGNGISTKQISVQNADVQEVTFTAGTFFELEPSTSEKIVAGRQQVGELISGPTDIERIMRDIIGKAKGNRGLEESLRSQLIARPDKGFMLGEAILPVAGMDKNVCWHEPCGACHHSGHVRCDQCAGQKFARCQQCHGQTMMQCPLCRGSGHIQGQRGHTPCNKCNGMRRVPCTVCMRTGKIPCKKCRASGSMTCPTCKGQAYSTRVVHLGMKAKTRADYARGNVPEHMTFLIENSGPQLVASGDISVSPQPMPDQNAMGVHYEAGFPFAAITFMVGQKPVKVDAYGAGKFVRLPHILDSLLAAPLQLLMQAARGEGNVADLLKEAGRYRAVAFALVTTIRANAAQTVKKLIEKYPEGLSAETAQKIGRAADSAVALITRKPRYAGLIVGLLLVAGLYAAYYIGPGRALLAPYMLDARYHLIADLSLIFIGGTISTLSVQLAAKGALHKALGHLIPAGKRKHFLPRTHGAGLWGYAGGAIIYVMMIEATRHIAHASTPDWYKGLMAMIGL